MLSYLSILHLVILCTHLIFLQENKAIVWVLLFFTVIQAIRVAVSIYVSDSIGRYLEILWNWLDLFGCLSLLLHCAGALFDEGMVLYRYYADAVLVSAFCMLLRGVSTISPFSTRIRLLLGVFIETFKDIHAFLILFAYMIGSMSVLHVVVKRADPLYQEKIKTIGFSYSLRETYRQTFGENPDLNVDLIEFIVYIIATLFLNIVTMNLLISIISETYDRVTMTQKATDNK